MAQLNDLLVAGASRLLNGLGILGSTNADSIFPNVTDTYALGSSDKRWNTLYAKTSNIDIQTVGTLTVTNYATIGANQAATGTGTGALRVSGGISATQNSWFGGNITTTKNISATGSGSFGGTLSAVTTVNINGDWETDFGLYLQEGASNGQYGAYFLYGVNDTLKIGTMNNNDKVTAITIGRGSTNVSIAGTVTAPTFSGALSGNATTATTLKTARTLTIGNTGKSFNGSANVSWTIAEIGAVNKTGDTMTGMLTINKTQTAAVFGGSVSNISSGAYNPTAGIQICAGSGGATNSTAIGFHNPNISSASIGYYNTDANNGDFKFLSDDLSWKVRIGDRLSLWSDNEGGNIRLYAPNSTTNCFEFDVYDGNLRLYYCTDDGSGTTGYKAWSWHTDGNAYCGSNLILHSGNWSSYCAAASHSHSYLPLSGGGLTGSPVITFPASAGSLSASTPFQITYGRIAAYGTLCINANTDNSGTEYVILTAGKGLSNSTNDGLAVGTSTLTWQGSNVLTQANYGSHTHTSVPIAGTNPVPSGSTDTTTTWGEKGNNTTWWYDSSGTLTDKPSDWGFVWNLAMGNDVSQLWFTQSSGKMMRRSGNASGWATSWKQIWCQGDSVTGAVWNDYAECREADIQEAGYVMIEKGDDTLTKSTERMQPFAGVSSDTWGFSQGETERAKTHIAVAGRALVYPYRPRDEYKPGDCVCAAPNGTVDIMTPNEVALHPDRIVGTVSCVPNYETWGGGELADRDPVQVNGRIWIKVR